MIKLKRIYEPYDKKDGYRVLVDRLWPRGISKERAHLDLWFEDIAPSTVLRKWYNHDPKKWMEFKKKYRVELKKNKDAVLILEQIKKKSLRLPSSMEQKMKYTTRQSCWWIC